MDNVVKAIDTVYDGNKFRSRLEARWAVFFHELGIEYEYEKEGYEITGHGKYLPDFWIPKNRIWIEIKGETPSIEYLEKMATFSQHLCTVLILAQGLPMQNSMWLFAADEYDDSGGGSYENEGITIMAVPGGKLTFC